jgi:transposase-like protein
MNEVIDGKKGWIEARPPEEWCWEELRKLRWTRGPKCPGCGKKAGRHYRRKYARYYWCRPCDRIFSDITATPFEGTHLPLGLWFLAVDLLRSGDRLTAKGLARFLGVDRQTAQRMRDRLVPCQADSFIQSIGISALMWKVDQRGGEDNGLSHHDTPH